MENFRRVLGASVGHRYRSAQPTRYALIILTLALIVTNPSIAGECSPLWVGDYKRNKLLSEYFHNLSSRDNSVIIVTPKALNTTLHSNKSLTILKKMDVLKINDIQIIYSEPCDKDVMLSLYKTNKNYLKDRSSKKSRLNLSGVDSRVLPQLYNKFCKTNIEIKKHEIFKTFIIHPDSVPGLDICKMFPVFLAAHGGVLVKENNQLYIKRSDNQFNLGAAKDAAPIN